MFSRHLVTHMRLTLDQLKRLIREAVEEIGAKVPPGTKMFGKEVPSANPFSALQKLCPDLDKCELDKDSEGSWTAKVNGKPMKWNGKQWQ